MPIPCLLELLLVLSSPQRDPDEVNLPLWLKAPEDLAVVHKQEHPVHKNVSEEAGNGRKVGMRLLRVFLTCFCLVFQTLWFLTSHSPQCLLVWQWKLERYWCAVAMQSAPGRVSGCNFWIYTFWDHFWCSLAQVLSSQLLRRVWLSHDTMWLLWQLHAIFMHQNLVQWLLDLPHLYYIGALSHSGAIDTIGCILTQVLLISPFHTLL